MSLEIYTEEQDEFLCYDEGDEYSCKICQQSMESTNEIYIHLKTHLDKQYDDNLKSFNENQNCSLCCVCNQNFLGIQNASNDPVTDGARDAIKTHYESHVRQLKQYLSKKVIFRDYYVIKSFKELEDQFQVNSVFIFQFNWDENNAHVRSSTDEEVDPAYSSNNNNKDHHEDIVSSPSSAFSPLLLRSSSNDDSAPDTSNITKNQTSSNSIAVQEIILDNLNTTSNETSTTQSSNEPTSNSANSYLPPGTSNLMLYQIFKENHF